MEDDDLLEKAILNLSKQMLNVERDLVALKAAVTVLKAYIAKRANPTDPQAVLKRLRETEKRLLDVDPNAVKRQEAADIFDVLLNFENYDPTADD
jgi:hypothetical protein